MCNVQLYMIYSVPGSPSDLNTGNRIEGATGCPSWCRPLRPLFYFLCYIHFSLSVQQTPVRTFKGYKVEFCEPDGIVLLDGVEVLVVVVPAADGVDLAPDGGQL